MEQLTRNVNEVLQTNTTFSQLTQEIISQLFENIYRLIFILEQLQYSKEYVEQLNKDLMEIKEATNHTEALQIIDRLNNIINILTNSIKILL